MATEVEASFCQWCAAPGAIETLLVDGVKVAQRHVEPVCERFALRRDRAERFNNVALDAVRARPGFTTFIGLVDRGG